MIRTLLFVFFAISVSSSNETIYPAWTSSAPKPTIVLDAGHGGTDHGARGDKPYCEEKKLTLLTTRLVKHYLQQRGYKVVLTRSTDVFVPLGKRVEIAHQSRAGLFVSIHFNAARSPAAQGIEVFFPENKSSRRVSASKRLAQTVLSRIIRRTQATSRGVKRGNLYVLRETDIPAILVEGGFISNPQERATIKSPAYLEKLARGIADGIDYYCKQL